MGKRETIVIFRMPECLLIIRNVPHFSGCACDAAFSITASYCTRPAVQVLINHTKVAAPSSSRTLVKVCLFVSYV